MLSKGWFGGLKLIYTNFFQDRVFICLMGYFLLAAYSIFIAVVSNYSFLPEEWVVYFRWACVALATFSYLVVGPAAIYLIDSRMNKTK